MSQIQFVLKREEAILGGINVYSPGPMVALEVSGPVMTFAQVYRHHPSNDSAIRVDLDPEAARRLADLLLTHAKVAETKGAAR